jgi:purine nucleosidase
MKRVLAGAGLTGAGMIMAAGIVIHAFTAPTTQPLISDAERFIVDVDHALDDTFALALALRSPELKIVGITLVPHPEAAQQARFAARMLRELGRESIPIAVGTSLLTNSCRCGHWDAITHALGVDYPAPVQESTAEFIVRQANATHGKVSILTFGPLTNLADALERDPNIAERISRVVMLAGNGRHAGNDCQEYNIATDIAAAQRVLVSGIPVLMVGVDVTARIVLRAYDLKQALAGQDSFSQVMRIYWQTSGGQSFCPHDLVAVAAAVNDKIGAWVIGNGSLGDDGCLSLRRAEEGNMAVATTVDVDEFRGFVVERLRGVPSVFPTARPTSVEPAATDVAGREGERGREKVIFDLEYITDDFFALAIALNAPELDVVGVTLVPHTASSNEARVVSVLLDSTGRGELPLALGEPGPYPRFKGGPWTAKDEEGLSGVSAHHLIKESAPDFMIRTVNASPGEISLITVGPLNNFGVALRRDPSIARKIKRLVMMGGSINKDYSFNDRPANDEHNVSDDLPATRTVFTSGIPILMVGLDATANLRSDFAELGRLNADAPGASRFLRERFQRFTGQFTPFDPMAVATAIDPSFCEVRRGHVEVTDDGYTRLVPNLPDNIEYCVNPNVEAFNEFMRMRLGVPGLAVNRR